MASFPDDREEIDRAFAEIVAGFHLTTDRPDPLLSEPLVAEPSPDQRCSELRGSDPRAAELRGELLGPDPRTERHASDGRVEPGAGDPLVARRQELAGSAPSAVPGSEGRPAEGEQLFRFVPLVPAAVDPDRTDRAPARRRLEDGEVEEVERFVPPPLEPLPRPGVVTVLGWIGIGYAVLFVLITAAGLRLPGWAGWLAIAGFGGALVILISRQPRHRPPGDGAVV
jgi:hypothetical protein